MPRYYSTIVAQRRRSPGRGHGRSAVARLASPDSGPTIFLGDEGNNIIAGTQGDDSITTFGGADIVNANGGNDTVIAGPGNDNVTGGPGDDVILYTGGGTVNLFGGEGNDTIDMDLAGGTVDTGTGVNVVRLKLTNQKNKTVLLKGTGDTLEITNHVSIQSPVLQVQSFDYALDTFIVSAEQIDLKALPSDMWFEEMPAAPDNLILHFSDSTSTVRFVGLATSFDGMGFDFGQNFGDN